jgi:hypothetical protein
MPRARASVALAVLVAASAIFGAHARSHHDHDRANTSYGTTLSPTHAALAAASSAVPSSARAFSMWSVLVALLLFLAQARWVGARARRTVGPHRRWRSDLTGRGPPPNAALI